MADAEKELLTAEEQEEIAAGIEKIVLFVSNAPPPRALLHRAVLDVLAEVDRATVFPSAGPYPHGEALRRAYERFMPAVVKRAVELGAPSAEDVAKEGEGREGVVSGIPQGGRFEASPDDGPKPPPGFHQHRRRW